MSERVFVVDTSALIHLLEGQEAAATLLLGAEIHLSVATEIELRTFSRIKYRSAEAIDRLIRQCTIWDLSPSIKEHCIQLRSDHRMKLADSLIAATAMALDLPLVTADKGFARLRGQLELIAL